MRLGEARALCDRNGNRAVCVELERRRSTREFRVHASPMAVLSRVAQCAFPGQPPGCIVRNTVHYPLRRGELVVPDTCGTARFACATARTFDVLLALRFSGYIRQQLSLFSG